MTDLVYVFNFKEEHLKGAEERLRCSISSVRKQTKKVRILLINASDIDTLDFKGEDDIVYVYKPYKDYFNKSVLINHIVKNYCQSDYFIFSDIDLIYKNDYVERTCEHIPKDDNHVRVVPYNFNLFEKTYTDNYEKAFNFNKHPKGGWAHGNGLIHRETFLKIRGYDEDFLGYGPEDDMFNKRISQLNTIKYDRNLVSLHLFHEPMNREFHGQNMNLFHSKISKLKDEIIGNKDTWGEYDG